MSALNVFLAIMGAVVTGMVITGMVLLEQGHLVSPAPQTDLSDVEPHGRTLPNTGRSTAAESTAERSRRSRPRHA